MRIRHLWISRFRSYEEAELDCPEGLCVLRGPNGVGKTNVLEAIAYLSTLRSFRHAPVDALVASGADSAVLRAEIRQADREVLIEAEIARSGRSRVQVNRQRVNRNRELRELLAVTVFGPSDLELIQGGPAVRRELLDEIAVSLHPRNDSLRLEWERVLRQRNALLKQSVGGLDESGRITLEVWDAKAAEAGEQVVEVRERLLSDLARHVELAYRDLAGGEHSVRFRYERSWSGDLHAALRSAHKEELRRGVTVVGPHRDEMRIDLNGLPARTHASQGEQRCLALALRLGGHRMVHSELGVSPVLLLDDVFSELDDQRSSALVASLPRGQAFLSTASEPPRSVTADMVVDVSPGVLRSGCDR